MKKPAAIILAGAAIVALGMQFYLNGEKPGLSPWGIRAWDLLRYFTILTNTLVVIVMLREAAGRSLGANWLATATLNIAMVGLIFQILLAAPEPLAGLAWWPDFLFHAGVPLGMVVWWLAFAPKDIGFAGLPRWLAWPVAYCVYILIRAQFDGNYVYFFLDVAKFGVPAIALNIAGLVLVFAAFGAGMILIARLMRRRQSA